MPHVGRLKKLVELDMFEVRISDWSLMHLTNLPDLASLELCGGRISDAGLMTIGTLTTLTRLNVAQNSSITDAGVRHLGRLAKLKHLNLSGTRVTPNGFAFVQALPEVVSLSVFGCEHIQSARTSDLPEVPDRVTVGLNSRAEVDERAEADQEFPTLASREADVDMTSAL